MRTTVTLDPDTRRLIERLMRERGLTFKAAVNQAIRLGLAPDDRAVRNYTHPRTLGPSRADLTKALALAAELENDAMSRPPSEGR